jgi:hypothetical protein
MVTKNVAAFSVRELDNQNAVIPFRTSQIATSSNYISGNGGTFTFHASGFVNRANVRQFMFVGNGLGPTNYNVEFFMTSSLVSSERQYFNQNIDLRTTDLPQQSILIFDNDRTECLHGKITNNTTSGYWSGMWMQYIDIRYNRMLEVS